MTFIFEFDTLNVKSIKTLGVKVICLYEIQQQVSFSYKQFAAVFHDYECEVKRMQLCI